jgi:hypothetical protein
MLLGESNTSVNFMKILTLQILFYSPLDGTSACTHKITYKTLLSYTRFESLKMVLINVQVFWAMRPCRLVKFPTFQMTLLPPFSWGNKFLESFIIDFAFNLLYS